MKTAVIIQARLGSTRLPGKVMADIAGQPMISRVVNRALAARNVDEVVVATPDSIEDEPLRNYCREQGWNVFAGSSNDVLGRYLGAARQVGASRIVRVTSDCPLIDPQLIDIAIAALGKGEQYDYVSNVWPKRTFPRGLDVEAFLLRALIEADTHGRSDLHREHVTTGIYQRPDKFRIGCVEYIRNNSEHRWTVDTEDDLQLIRRIYSHFEGTPFQTSDVLEAFEKNVNWKDINSHIQQKVA